MDGESDRTSYADLIRAIGQAEGIAIKDVRRILDAAVEAINERVARRGTVVLGGLGTFRGSQGATGRRVTFRRSGAGRPPSKATAGESPTD